MSTALVCPTNQKAGQALDSLTVKALLARSLAEVRPVAYGFCEAPNCPTVYYSADGTQLFDEGDLREKVYQKHRADSEVLVCYCFQYTVEAIRDEIRQTGHSTAVRRIADGVRAGQCACDIRNPQGNCCIGNVRLLVRQITQELAP